MKPRAWILSDCLKEKPAKMRLGTTTGVLLDIVTTPVLDAFKTWENFVVGLQ